MKRINHARPIPLRCGLLALIAFVASFAPAIAFEATSLRCEYGVDPMGIDDPHPRLFWQLASDQHGQAQSAYRIQVAESAGAFASAETLLWDTDRVQSDATIGIRYGGVPLASGQRVFWRVQCWDREGRASAWSPPAQWTMGLLEPSDWDAQWIGRPEVTDNTLLRTEFECREGLQRAIVFVCGLGHYELTFNGVKASDHLLSPGWTEYSKTTLYDTFDVTELMRRGPNAVGIALGNGMYRVDRRHGHFAKFVADFGPQRAILRLQLEYKDGTRQIVATDDSWQAAVGPITYSNIFSGEDYDARQEPRGWDSAGFAAGGNWVAAAALAYPLDTLRGFTAASDPLRAIESKSPIVRRQINQSGAMLFDLGQNASYLPRIVVSGPAGSRVRLIPGELIYPDGRVTRSSMGGIHRGSGWWEYTKATDADEAWSPKFYYQGFRYLQTQAYAAEGGGPLPAIEQLEGIVIHSAAQPIGAFACSNPLLNRIRDLVRWAQRSNMVSVLTDCPHREKLGWLEQYHLNGPAIRYEFNMARMFRKGVSDMADAQTADGLVPNIAPEYTQFKGAFRSAAEWGSACIIVPWQQYQFLGDTDLLAESYAGMVRYFSYLASKEADGIVTEGLGDWYDVGPAGSSSSAQLTDAARTATAFYAYDAWILSRVARILGKADEAEGFDRAFARIAARYNESFFDRSIGSYGAGSQTANALPLALGLADSANRASSLAALAKNVEECGYTMTAGDVGFRFLLKALAEGGHNETIYKMLTQTEKPIGYAYVLDQGATAMTESWTASRTSSNNHFMLGHVTEWFYESLLGIANVPGSVGFQHIQIAPTPVGDLAWAEGRYESIHGTIDVRWERIQTRFRLEVTIPPNSTGLVALPSDAPHAVSGLGPHARLAGNAGGRALVEIGSGHYTLETEWSGKERF